MSTKSVVSEAKKNYKKVNLNFIELGPQVCKGSTKEKKAIRKKLKRIK